MKKPIQNLPRDVILRAAQAATQKAVLDAVKAGRVVAGWKNGQLVAYGLGARYPADAGALSQEDLVELRNAAQPLLPKGQV